MNRLVNGQNTVWPGPWLQAIVHGLNCDVAALLVGDDLQARGDDDLVFRDRPTGGGVRWAPGPPDTITVDLTALTAARVLVVLSVGPGAAPLGTHAPRIVLSTPQGPHTEFLPAGLSTERALICCEVYRRNGQWKVRAVGQGYDGGLAAAVRAHGIEITGPAPAAVPAPAPVPGGPTELQQIMHQMSGIFDDASRSASGLESTLRYAEQRLLDRTDDIVSDPRLRNSPEGQAARSAAQREHDAMVEAARHRHRQDTDQLLAEHREWELRALAPLADWTAPAWQHRQAPTTATGSVRLGVAHTEHAPQLQLPFVTGVPLRRPLRITTGPAGDPQAQQVVQALLLRLLAAFPPGGLQLAVADLAGHQPFPFPPLGAAGCRVQPRPGATNLPELTALLDDLAHRCDLARMAHQGGLHDELDDLVPLVLVVTGFPVGFDETALRHLEAITRLGLPVVQVVLTGGEIETTDPVVQTVVDRCQTLTSEPGGGFVDRPTGVVWRYLPDEGPGSPNQVQAELTRASRGDR